MKEFTQGGFIRDNEYRCIMTGMTILYIAELKCYVRSDQKKFQKMENRQATYKIIDLQQV